MVLVLRSLSMIGDTNAAICNPIATLPASSEGSVSRPRRDRHALKGERGGGGAGGQRRSSSLSGMTPCYMLIGSRQENRSREATLQLQLAIFNHEKIVLPFLRCRERRDMNGEQLLSVDNRSEICKYPTPVAVREACFPITATVLIS